MADARVTEQSVSGTGTVGIVGPEVEDEAAVVARHDQFWGKYKVPWKFYETPEPSQETQKQLQSLGLWKPGYSAAQDNMVSLAREDQRQLKQNKKRKEKHEDAEDEGEEEEPRAKKQKAQAKPKAKAKAKAKGKAKATPKQPAKAPVDAEEEGEQNPGQPPSPARGPPSPCPEENPGQPPSPACPKENPGLTMEAVATNASSTKGVEKRKRRRAGDHGYKPSFARRVKPDGERASTQWLAIRDAFNLIIRPHAEGCASTHEDGSYGAAVCSHNRMAVCIGICTYVCIYTYIYRHA